MHSAGADCAHVLVIWYGRDAEGRTRADPTLAGRLTNTGQAVNPGGPKGFAADIAKQRKQAVDAAKILGLKEATF